MNKKREIKNLEEITFKDILLEENKKQRGKRKSKREKGVTLIALVITIIILLILAGVTLSGALSDNGLFQKAKKAAEEYKKAEETESKAINDIVKEMDEIKNLDEIKSLDGGIDNLVTGDLVKYILKDGKEIKCQVLYDKKYNEQNEKNYGVQIIALEPICEVELEKITGYENGVEKLTTKAEEYNNSEYSSKSRPLGSAPGTDKEYGEDYERLTDLVFRGKCYISTDKPYWYCRKVEFDKSDWDDKEMWHIKSIPTVVFEHTWHGYAPWISRVASYDNQEYNSGNQKAYLLPIFILNE